VRKGTDFGLGQSLSFAATDTMPKNKTRAFDTSVRDYPESMSLYERDSLAAEAVLAARRNAKKSSNKKSKRLSKPA
jgi:hypothetical protein